jgi:hypothetical protein
VPGRAKAPFHRYSQLSECGDHEAAIPSWRRVVSSQEHDASVWVSLGWALSKVERFGDAVEAYKQANGVRSDSPRLLSVNWQRHRPRASRFPVSRDRARHPLPRTHIAIRPSSSLAFRTQNHRSPRPRPGSSNITIRFIDISGAKPWPQSSNLGWRVTRDVSRAPREPAFCW